MRINATTRNRALAATASMLAILAALLAQDPLGDRAGAATAGASGKTAGASGKRVTIATRKFHMGRPDQKSRLTVRCPNGRWPMGGGVRTNPPLSADGEGVYPHSYERLGVQGGFHTTPVLFDPSPSSTRHRIVKLQVACGRKLGPVTPPHTTRFVRPGQTKTVVATCPGRRHLFGGGFQRTDFVSSGGNFVTESRAISGKSWSVTAHAFGNFGGEITAIGYCVRSRRPLLTEVSASTTLARGAVETVRTPSCPGGRHLTFGGFSSSPHGSVLMADGAFNRDRSWSTSAFNHFGPAAKLTAYGYCLKL